MEILKGLLGDIMGFDCGRSLEMHLVGWILQGFVVHTGKAKVDIPLFVHYRLVAIVNMAAAPSCILFV